MDEETPEVFTVSVGNLPPGARVIIKITYVAELGFEQGDICFSLPGSVAPCKRTAALDQVRGSRPNVLLLLLLLVVSALFIRGIHTSAGATNALLRR